MHPIARLFSPLRKAAAAFFQHDVALRRRRGSVQIVLEARAPGGAGKTRGGKLLSRERLLEQKEEAELSLMREQLAALLGEMPETRQALRHLVFVEQALARKGMRALHRLPLDVLQHALEQLEGLVTNWSPVGLANLRSKMAVAIIDREHMDPDAEADAYRTAAVLDHGAQPAQALEPDMLQTRTDEAALAAAYAALGVVGAGRDSAAAKVQMHGELDSPSAKAALREAARPTAQSAERDDILLRLLET